MSEQTVAKPALLPRTRVETARLGGSLRGQRRTRRLGQIIATILALLFALFPIAWIISAAFNGYPSLHPSQCLHGKLQSVAQ